MSNSKFPISAQEYQEKRYEIASKVLASAIARTELQDGDSKLRASFLFNCVQIADLLLEELGYAEAPSKASSDKTTVISLSTMLKEGEKKP